MSSSSLNADRLVSKHSQPSNPSTKENDTVGRPTPPIRRTRTKTSMFMPKPKKQEGIQGQNVSLSFTGMLPNDKSREIIDKWKPMIRAEWRASAACAKATQRSALLAKRSMNKVVGREHAQSTASKGGKALGSATVKVAALSTGLIRTSATESTKNRAAVGSCDSYKKQLRHAPY
ncbi:hypothetical protein CPC08DRAFT_776576 [Agrocybe pediades]|nr:hypothetical protein CPC08DRAFT_776576 [Agrocybe pediades]